jgi:AcrR family transcriptional regulator
MSAPLSTTDRICLAAIRTVIRDGLLALTLDNVAKEAGVSKGGVMYHFPTKDQLVTAMLTYFSTQAERMLMARIAEDPEPRRRWVRAMVSCLFPHSGGSESAAPELPAWPGDDAGPETLLPPEVMHRFMLAVLAAAVNNPGLMEPMRQLGKRMIGRLMADPEDGLDQLLIWLAVDGLFLWQFVGMLDPADPLYQQLGAALLRQTAPAARANQPATVSHGSNGQPHPSAGGSYVD